MSKVKCPRCLKEYAVKANGEIRKHPCFEATDLDRAVDTMTPQQCSEPKCTRRGDGGPEHELAIIGAFDDPTPAGPGHELAIIAYGNDPVDGKGPWFGALYDGRCSSCDDAIYEGDRIRADGQGGYECECGDEGLGAGVDWKRPADHGDWQEQASVAAKRYATLANAEPSGEMAEDSLEVLREEALNQIAVTLSIPKVLLESALTPLPTPEAFMDFEDPTTPAEKPRKINVSGQPEPNRDWQKRYIVKDPATDDFRWQKNGKAAGITRVTTFNKAAQDSKAINDWGKRNVVIGASLRPDILRRAHGLVHEGGREELDRIVGELETAAGAKVSADEGTYLHEETEKIDAGLQTWRDSPAAYQQDLKRYVEALEEAGLEPVPGLIERTTMISEFGGVCGTFDRIFYHRDSGSYVIGDLKTGKTMKYVMDETQTQLWCYAHGVNTNGIYDWNTDAWLPSGTYGDSLETGPWQVPKVREDVGVIVHMPVQGPEAGTVNVLVADLTAGRVHAELCHTIRSRPKHKPVPWASWVEPEPPAPLTWPQRFAAVVSKEEATALWREAKAEGVHPMTLQDLIRIARDALADKG